MKTNIEFKLVPKYNVVDKLEEIMVRDSKVINRVLGILNYEQKEVFSKSRSGKWHTSRKILSHLLLSTKNRKNPKYDLKQEFVNISHNELMECIDRAVEIFTSHLELKDSNSQYAPSAPKLHSIVSRRINHRRFDIDPKKNKISTIYSCKSNLAISLGKKKRVKHDYISFKFLPHNQAVNLLEQGEARGMEIIRKKDDYYAHICIEVETPTYKPPNNKLAVVGIDLGISKTATLVLYSQGEILDKLILSDPDFYTKLRQIEEKIAIKQRVLSYRKTERYQRFFHQIVEKIDNPKISERLLIVNQSLKEGNVTEQMINEVVKQIVHSHIEKKYRKRILEVLKELKFVVQNGFLGKKYNLRKSIGRLKNKRANLREEMIKLFCHEAQNFIQEYSKKFDLFISIGKPNGIRRRYQKGSGNKWIRKRINQWGFYKFQKQLKHNLTKIGLDKRYIEVNEAWTSILCFSCNKRGIRPKQDIFYCSNYYCKIKINADINGAINIGKRGLVHENQISKEDYPKWNIEIKSAT